MRTGRWKLTFLSVTGLERPARERERSAWLLDGVAALPRPAEFTNRSICR